MDPAQRRDCGLITLGLQMALKPGIKQAYSIYYYCYSENYPTLEITLFSGHVIRQQFMSAHLGRNPVLLHTQHLVTCCAFYLQTGFTD